MAGPEGPWHGGFEKRRARVSPARRRRIGGRADGVECERRVEGFFEEQELERRDQPVLRAVEGRDSGAAGRREPRTRPWATDRGATG